mmetsp:Transcript_6178/g.10191  ORF Transcript_6178/g.10191 Transcript_6178/m.10191 type:complete len:235 (-) Transcript_6178:568-1272(-)
MKTIARCAKHIRFPRWRRCTQFRFHFLRILSFLFFHHIIPFIFSFFFLLFFTSSFLLLFLCSFVLLFLLNLLFFVLFLSLNHRLLRQLIDGNITRIQRNGAINRNKVILQHEMLLFQAPLDLDNAVPSIRINVRIQQGDTRHVSLPRLQLQDIIQLLPVQRIDNRYMLLSAQLLDIIDYLIQTRRLRQQLHLRRHDHSNYRQLFVLQRLQTLLHSAQKHLIRRTAHFFAFSLFL